MTPLECDLARVCGEDALVPVADAAPYLHDSTEMQGLGGWAEAVIAPADVEGVRRAVAWCCDHGVAMVPRGGGTGFAGGAVPRGGAVLLLERLSAIRELSTGAWLAEVEAGVTTARLHRAARDHGLYFPVDPGASEQSQVGGNLACNAGGPHSYRHGVMRDWVTGVEAVVDGGELVRFGGRSRKDVAGYDLVSLFAGSEGTLGVITAATVRLAPAPEAELPVAAFYSSAEAGAAAVAEVRMSGAPTAVLEFLDSGALAASGAAFPGGVPAGAAFLVLCEAAGPAARVEAEAAEVEHALASGSMEVRRFAGRAAQEALWRWRSGVSYAVSAVRGGKMSEDVAVPVERLADAIALAVEAGAAAGLPACSWGHAGDANLHATFMVDATSPAELERAARAAEQLFAGVLAMGGTVSGEHGLGLVKREQLSRQYGEPEMRLFRAVKAAFDPRGLFNPGKKVVPA